MVPAGSKLYVVLTMDTPKFRDETEPTKNILMPSWNKEFSVPYDQGSLSTLNIEVYYKRRRWLKSEYLASHIVPLKEYSEREGTKSERCHYILPHAS